MSIAVSRAADGVRSNSERKFLAICYGVVCHVIFLLGVGSMMAAMFFGMSRSLGRVPAPWSWVANVALLAAFPLAHSLLLTNRGRALLARLAPRESGSTLSATTFATIAAFQVFLLFAFWSPSGTVWWHASGVVFDLLCALYVAAWLLLGKAMMDAGLGLQTGSLGWMALFRGRKPVYPGMPQTGLFRFSRQPIYVSFALTVWTVPTWTPDQLAIAVTLTLYCLVGPRFKEARYRRIYGPDFDSYARNVSYWLPRRQSRG